MTNEIIYEKSYCKISYFKEIGIAMVELIGEFNIQQYKDLFTNTLNVVVEKQATGLILDQTLSKGGSMESRAWLVMSWLPELKSKVKNPKFRIAGINPAKFGFKKFIADYLEAAAKKVLPFEIKSCPTLEDAIKWIS